MSADFAEKSTQGAHHFVGSVSLNLGRMSFSLARVIKSAEFIIWTQF
ncbi:hypothetical protein SynMEDNS5_00797 [Synechococcus sp. MEDNS5]|nr:hypothetical protein SynMEDNS5_00797 [Synechococcus sp. MEDNS5]